MAEERQPRSVNQKFEVESRVLQGCSGCPEQGFSRATWPRDTELEEYSGSGKALNGNLPIIKYLKMFTKSSLLNTTKKSDSKIGGLYKARIYGSK
jgi:hypothetical protein